MLFYSVIILSILFPLNAMNRFKLKIVRIYLGETPRGNRLFQKKSYFSMKLILILLDDKTICRRWGFENPHVFLQKPIHPFRCQCILEKMTSCQKLELSLLTHNCALQYFSQDYNLVFHTHYDCIM